MRLFAYQNFLILFFNKFSELNLIKISMEVSVPFKEFKFQMNFLFDDLMINKKAKMKKNLKI